MDKIEFEKIINDQGNLKNLPNSELTKMMDALSTTFDATKDNIIKLTIYLDKIEELYNNTLKEYQIRTNDK